MAPWKKSIFPYEGPQRLYFYFSLYLYTSLISWNFSISRPIVLPHEWLWTPYNLYHVISHEAIFMIVIYDIFPQSLSIGKRLYVDGISRKVHFQNDEKLFNNIMNIWVYVDRPIFDTEVNCEPHSIWISTFSLRSAIYYEYDWK